MGFDAPEGLWEAKVFLEENPRAVNLLGSRWPWQSRPCCPPRTTPRHPLAYQPKGFLSRSGPLVEGPAPQARGELISFTQAFPHKADGERASFHRKHPSPHYRACPGRANLPWPAHLPEGGAPPWPKGGFAL